jgi:hypothetical protein
MRGEKQGRKAPNHAWIAQNAFPSQSMSRKSNICTVLYNTNREDCQRDFHSTLPNIISWYFEVALNIEWYVESFVCGPINALLMGGSERGSSSRFPDFFNEIPLIADEIIQSLITKWNVELRNYVLPFPSIFL